MFTEKDTLNKSTVGYGSVITPNSKHKNVNPRACRSQSIFIILLLTISISCIIFSIYPIKKTLISTKIEEIDTTLCETHICLYEMSDIPDIDLTNPQIQLLQNHPSTIKAASKFAFINLEKFASSPQTLTITHTQGTIISIPLKAYTPTGLYYFEDAFENRFVLTLNTQTKTVTVEGYAWCNAQKYELHSIEIDNEDGFYLLIEKNSIQDTTNWCGIFDINTKYNELINIDNNGANNGDMNEDIVIWLNTNNMITNHVGLDGLFINKGSINAYDDTVSFLIEPLCSDLSVYDGFVYCLYPDTHVWDEFNALKFYQYSNSVGVWYELSDFVLDMGGSSVNVPKSMVVMMDNEVYVFAVNPTDLMVNIYSFTTAWRLHHYMPVIGGDLDKIEIDSIYVDGILYFSINEYDPLGVYSVYNYMDDIFSEENTFSKTEMSVYSHCLTQFEGVLLMYYVDYGHNLFAFYEGVQYDMEFNIANEIGTNQFKCIWSEKGNIISWKYDAMIYYVQISVDDFKLIEYYSDLPWTVGNDEGNLFQLIALRNGVNNYKSVSVYYTDDILHNYLTDFELLAMDVALIVSLSNIMYSMHNDYKDMMRLNSILLYKENIDAFIAYDHEGESDINILLVDAMSDDDEIGYSQCDENEQSFAVVEYTVF